MLRILEKNVVSKKKCDVTFYLKKKNPISNFEILKNFGSILQYVGGIFFISLALLWGIALAPATKREALSLVLILHTEAFVFFWVDGGLRAFLSSNLLMLI